MALSEGIQRVTVHIGSESDFTGEVLAGAIVTFIPTTTVVWEADGSILFRRPLPVTLDETGAGSITLPATDQDGFVDGAGNAVKDWKYLVRWSFPQNLRDVDVPLERLISLPAATPEVSLNLLIPVTGDDGITTVLQPTVMSVNGDTGHVTLDFLASPPAGTPQGYRARTNVAGLVVWKRDRVDVSDWCSLDGTDDTANVTSMIAYMLANNISTFYNSTSSPISIAGTVYIPKLINFIGDAGSADPGSGARFVAIGKEAQVVVHDRGGKSGPWLFDGNGIADPTQHSVVANLTQDSTLVTIVSIDGVAATNTAIDALWGKVVTLQDSSLDTDTLYQTVVTATPSKAGYTASTTATGKVRVAGAPSATVAGATGYIGENVFVHFLKPGQRQLDTLSVVGSIAATGCAIDKISNATFINFQVTKNRFDGLALGRNGAGGVFVGQTHLAGNGRRQLTLRDDMGAAAKADSRNVRFQHLICETLGALGARVVSHRSYDRVTIGHLAVTMNEVIPTFALNTVYSEIPQFKGVGPANVVDSGGRYYQVVKGAGTFTAVSAPGTAGADAAKWELVSDAVSLWHFGYEPSAPAQVVNAVKVDSFSFQGNNANRTYGFDSYNITADTDTSKTPYLVITGPFSGQNMTAKIRWSDPAQPIPVIAGVDELPNTPLIVGAGVANGWASVTEPVRLIPASALISNDTAIRTLSGQSRKFEFNKLGTNKTVRVRAFGLYNCKAASGTFTAKVRVNNSAVASPVIVVNQTAATGTAQLWSVDLDLIIESLTATGVGSSVSAQGHVGKTTAATGTQSVQVFQQAAATVDLSSGFNVDIAIQMATADPLNSAQVIRGDVQLLP